MSAGEGERSALRLAARVAAGFGRGDVTGGLSSLKLEALVLALVALTCAAIVWQDVLLKRTIVFEPANASAFVGYGYGDEANGGASRVTVDPNRPLSWACELREDYEYPYCGYELLIDAERYARGLDLSAMQTLTVAVSYRGSADLLRMHLKNHDPRYSRPGKSETSKFNRIEFPARQGHQRVELKLADFGVAEWWLTSNRIPPALSRPQFDNVISLDFQTGSGTKPGKHSFAIHSITIEGWALTPARWYLGILSVWLVLILLYLGYRISRLKRDLRKKQAQQAVALREAEEAARRDHLTGLLNRTGVADRYARMVADAAGCRSVSVILIDADHFKSLNDRYGHNYGDEVLASFAQILRRNLGADDIVGRWGGEEFIVICSNLDERAALGMANKLRSRIEHFHFGECETVTASFGVCWERGAPRDLPELVDCADTALYLAKERGRNRAVMYHSFMKRAA